jgi:GxxExxY protein
MAEEHECFVDEDLEPNPELNRITNAIIGAAIEVHRIVGPGQLEAAYEEAMAIEMNLRQISFKRQLDIDLIYKGHTIGKGRLDFLVEGLVVLDLQAVERLAPVHTAQMISYLTITGHQLALLINFNVPALRHGIKRIAGRPRPSQSPLCLCVSVAPPRILYCFQCPTTATTSTTP